MFFGRLTQTPRGTLRVVTKKAEIHFLGGRWRPASNRVPPGGISSKGCNFRAPRCVKPPVTVPEDENRLLDRILAGEEHLYQQLVERYKRYVFTLALKIVNNRDEAEEAAQDAFVKAFQYLKGFNRQAKFSTWLYRIAFNTAVSYKRKQRTGTQPVEGLKVAGGAAASDAVEAHEKTAFVNLALAQLNEADRLALQLFYLHEFTLEEVAATLAQNVNTVKVRIHRARVRLGEELKKILHEEAVTL